MVIYMKRDKKLNQIDICNMLDISYSTLIRQRGDEEMNFPKPVSVGKEKYWDENDVMEWIENRLEQ